MAQTCGPTGHPRGWLQHAAAEAAMSPSVEDHVQHGAKGKGDPVTASGRRGGKVPVCWMNIRDLGASRIWYWLDRPVQVLRATLVSPRANRRVSGPAVYILPWGLVLLVSRNLVFALSAIYCEFRILFFFYISLLNLSRSCSRRGGS